MPDPVPMAMTGGSSPAPELARAAARLHSALPLASALASAVEELRAAIRAQAVALARTTHEPGELLYTAAAGPGATGLIGARMSSAIGLMSGTIAASDLTLATDVRRERERLPLLDQLAQARARSQITIPLAVAGHVIGILQALNPIGRNAFGAEERAQLAAAASLIATALAQRGEHRHAGLAGEPLAELELRRRSSAWSAPAEAFLRELCTLAETGRPMIVRGEPGSGRERAVRALAAWLGARDREAEGAFVLVDGPDLALAAAQGSTSEPAAFPALRRLMPAGGTLYLQELGAVPAQHGAALGALLTALRSSRRADGAVRITAAFDVGVTPITGAPDVPVDLRRFFGDAELTMPALGSRPEDVPAIAGEIVRRLKGPLGSRALGFEPAALALLAAEPWPRNVDSLRQRVAALLFASDADWIGPSAVAEQMSGSAPGGEGATISRRIESALAAADPSARAAALRRLELSGRPVPAAALPSFLALLEDANDWLRIHAARILAAHPDRRALAPLVARLEHEPDPAVRRELVTALGRIATPAVAGPLLPHLSDTDPDVRAAALLALGRIGGDVARSAAATMARDPDPRVRATALGAGFLIEAAAGPGPAPVVAAVPAVGSAPASGGGGGSAPVAARLVIVPPAGKGEQEPRSLTGESLTIGRTGQNDLSLPDPAVSKRHASLFRRGEEWVVRDEGSTNGTRVNGIRVAEHDLDPGDEIGIGTYVLRFELEAERRLATPVAIANDLESTLFRTAAGALPAAFGIASHKPAQRQVGLAVAQLLDETRSEDREARRWAARVLGDLGQGVARLIELAAGDPDPEVRLEATRALGRTRSLEAVPPLKEKLGDRWLRIAAIEALGTLRAPAAVDSLLDLLRVERSSRERRAVVRALGQIGEERATSVLAELTRSKEVGADAVAALAQIGGPGATARLVAALDAGNPLCADAVRGIARLKAQEAIPQLVGLLAADDELIAQRAEEALVAIGPSAIEALVAALALPDERPRAIRALAAIDHPAAAEALVPLAAESVEARIALRRMGRRALPALYAALDRDPEPVSRLLASMRESEREEIAGLLIEHLSTKSAGGDSAPRWIDRTLVVLGSQAVERLRGLVRESPAQLQKQALRILGQIGEGEAAAAIPELLAASEAPDDVGIAAWRAMTPVADAEVAAAIRRRWPELGPTARGAAVAAWIAFAAERGGEAGAAALDTVLADPSTEVRCAGALAAAELPEPFAALILRKLLSQDPDDGVRAVAAALGAPDHPASAEIPAELTHLLGVPGSVGCRLRDHLARHEPDRWRQLLWELVNHPDEDRTRLLLDALLELREPAR